MLVNVTVQEVDDVEEPPIINKKKRKTSKSVKNKKTKKNKKKKVEDDVEEEEEEEATLQEDKDNDVKDEDNNIKDEDNDIKDEDNDIKDDAKDDDDDDAKDDDDDAKDDIKDNDIELTQRDHGAEPCTETEEQEEENKEEENKEEEQEEEQEKEVQEQEQEEEQKQVQVKSTMTAKQKEASKRIVQVEEMTNFQEHVVFDDVNTGNAFSTVSMKNSNGSGSLVLQFNSGANFPVFAFDKGKYGTNITWCMEDETEIENLTAMQEYLRNKIANNKDTWMAGCKKSKNFIYDSFVPLITPQKKTNKGVYPAQCKAMIVEDDLLASDPSKRAKVVCVDEDGNNVALDTLKGRRWIKILVTIKNIYLQSTGTTGVSKRISYMLVGPPGSGTGGVGSTKEFNVVDFDLARDAVMADEATKNGTRQTIDVATSDGEKIILNFNGGGSCPKFAIGENAFGATSLTVNIGNDAEFESLKKVQNDFADHIVENRGDFAPGSKSSDETLREGVYAVVAQGTNKKTGQPYDPTFKCNFVLKPGYKSDGFPMTSEELAAAEEAEKKKDEADERAHVENEARLGKEPTPFRKKKAPTPTMVVDTDGNEVEPTDIAFRQWRSLQARISCGYIQSKKNFGLSRSAVKLVVEKTDCDEDLVPLPVAKRQKKM